jgi:hypothetical protein
MTIGDGVGSPLGACVEYPFSFLQDVNAQHSSSAGHSFEFPEVHLIGQVSSASAHDVPQKNVRAGSFLSMGGFVGESVGLKVIVGSGVGVGLAVGLGVGDFDGRPIGFGVGFCVGVPSTGFAVGFFVGGLGVGGSVARKSHGVCVQQYSNSGQSLSSSQCCFVSQLSLASAQKAPQYEYLCIATSADIIGLPVGLGVGSGGGPTTPPFAAASSFAFSI